MRSEGDLWIFIFYGKIYYLFFIASVLWKALRVSWSVGFRTNGFLFHRGLPTFLVLCFLFRFLSALICPITPLCVCQAVVTRSPSFPGLVPLFVALSLYLSPSPWLSCFELFIFQIEMSALHRVTQFSALYLRCFEQVLSDENTITHWAFRRDSAAV